MNARLGFHRVCGRRGLEPALLLSYRPEGDRSGTEDGGRNDSGDYRHDLWLSGSQWLYGGPSGYGRLVAKSWNRSYVYATGDATQLYNSTYEGATDVTEATRSIIWVKPDDVIVYDREESKTPGQFKRVWF